MTEVGAGIASVARPRRTALPRSAMISDAVVEHLDRPDRGARRSVEINCRPRPQLRGNGDADRLITTVTAHVRLDTHVANQTSAERPGRPRLLASLRRSVSDS